MDHKLLLFVSSHFLWDVAKKVDFDSSKSCDAEKSKFVPRPLTCKGVASESLRFYVIWVVVKIMVPFWVPIIIQDLLFRVPKKGP